MLGSAGPDSGEALSSPRSRRKHLRVALGGTRHYQPSGKRPSRTSRTSTCNPRSSRGKARFHNLYGTIRTSHSHTQYLRNSLTLSGWLGPILRGRRPTGRGWSSSRLWSGPRRRESFCTPPAQMHAWGPRRGSPRSFPPRLGADAVEGGRGRRRTEMLAQRRVVEETHHVWRCI